MAKKLRSMSLRTVGDCNRLLAKTINELRRDEIDYAKASKIGYLCNILIGGIRVFEFESILFELQEDMRLLQEQRDLILMKKN